MNSPQSVQEVPGYYGSVKIEETVFQQIWAEQDFFSDSLVTTCGKKIVVVDRGDWNRSEEGPDFRHAKLQIDGKARTGDIEIHFQPSDWKSHGHHIDPNFDRVILQVCIFAGPWRADWNVRLQNGDSAPTLVLLPYLFYGIEEYAEAHALAKLSGKDSHYHTALEKLAKLSSAEISQNILKRWKAKIGFAEVRLSTQPWENVAHQWFLEVLGYRRNRSPMIRIAHQFPWKDWQGGEIHPLEVYKSQHDWKLRGCRPANHPRVRIAQYAQLWRENPDWLDDLQKFSEKLKENCEGFQNNRKKILELENFWKKEILHDVFAKGKANTLWIDFAQPLLSAHFTLNGYELWKNGSSGDSPACYRQWARELGWVEPRGNKIFSNGMVQGILEALSR